MNDAITLRDKILLAAAALDKRQGQFTANDLVVEAHKLDYQAFGLEGYVSIPDSNRVLYNLMGAKGMVSQGLLVKVGPKRYGLTKLGRNRVAQLNGKEPEPIRINGTELKKLTKPMAEFLGHCRQSNAAVLFGAKGDITFTMACSFWKIFGDMKGKEIRTALKEFEGRLALLDVELADEDRLLPDDTIVTAGDVREVRHIHNWLLDRFEKHVELLKNRK